MKQNSSKLMEDIKKFLTGKKTDYVEIGGHRFAEKYQGRPKRSGFERNRRPHAKR